MSKSAEAVELARSIIADVRTAVRKAEQLLDELQPIVDEGTLLTPAQALAIAAAIEAIRETTE